MDVSAPNGALPVASNVEWATWSGVQYLSDYMDVVDLTGRDTVGRSIRGNGNLTPQYVRKPSRTTRAANPPSALLPLWLR